MKSLFKRFDTSGHFPDFKHTAKGQRDNKKIRSKKERRILNRENREEKLLDAMIDLWVKDDAPEWIKQQVKEELRKQRREH